MCGHFGMVGKGIIPLDYKVFQEGMRTIAIRGPHSTGVGWWDSQDPGIDYIKHNKEVFAFFKDKEVVEKLEAIKDPLAMMGHARLATKGAITPENAHPFRQGHILLNHNGTLNHIIGMHGYNKFESDSEALAFYIQDKGIDQAVKNISGAYALAYIDDKSKTFNLIRNNQRDMFIAQHKYRNVYYYSSERLHLEWILKRNNLDVNAEGISQLPIETLYSYSLDKGEMSKRKIDSNWYNADKYAYRGPASSFFEGLPKSDFPDTKPPMGNGYIKGPVGDGKEYLDRYGVKIHDWIKVKLTDYESYTPNSNCGKVTGEFEGVYSPDAYVIGYLYTPEDHGGKLFEAGWYAAKVSGCRYSPEKASYIIHLEQYSKIGLKPDIKEPELRVKPEDKPDEKPVVKFKSDPPPNLSRKKFEAMTKKGCRTCSANLHWHKKHRIVWIADNNLYHPVCNQCIQSMEEGNMTEADLKDLVFDKITYFPADASAMN